MTLRNHDRRPAPLHPPKRAGYYFLTALTPNGTMYSRATVRMRDFEAWVSPEELDRAERRGWGKP